MNTIEKWDRDYGKEITDILCGSATPGHDLHIAVQNGKVKQETAARACREVLKLEMGTAMRLETAFAEAHDC